MEDRKESEYCLPESQPVLGVPSKMLFYVQVLIQMSESRGLGGLHKGGKLNL